MMTFTAETKICAGHGGPMDRGGEWFTSAPLLSFNGWRDGCLGAAGEASSPIMRRGRRTP
jgi:hypothetical protein